jgi:surfactin synthase thioesterase subunit
VVGAQSKIVSAGEAELYRTALGDLLQIVVVPGGHTVLWDAFEETATAIERFLEP